jgi:pimeloyl-ACP methyl ester carboxylesterase
MSRLVDLGDVRLSVREQGAGPPIVFLHGFPENGDAWGAVADQLSDAFRCILPDQRGYRLSGKPDDARCYAIDHLIADVDALATSLGIDRFALAGHDWGGVVAWWYAARRRDRLTHLIIANAPHPALFQQRILDDPDQRQASQYITRLRAVGSEQSVPGATKTMVDWYRAAPFIVPEPGVSDATADWLGAEDFTVRVPTLVLWGTRDAILLPVLLDGLDEYVPNLRVERFAESSHNIIHEHPAALAVAIKAFLA